MARITQEEMDALADAIRRAFPEGLDKETGRLVYSALAGGELVMRDGRRLHRSWRGTGAAIVDAGAPGDYVDYYLGFRPHDDPEVAEVRERLLALPDVARIESAPRDSSELNFPVEEEDPAHETGWNLSVVFESKGHVERLAQEAAAAGKGLRPQPAESAAVPALEPELDVEL